MTHSTRERFRMPRITPLMSASSLSASSALSTTSDIGQFQSAAYARRSSIASGSSRSVTRSVLRSASEMLRPDAFLMSTTLPMTESIGALGAQRKGWQFDSRKAQESLRQSVPEEK